MKKIISTIIGFEWVQNVAAKKVARAAALALVALGAKSQFVAGLLAAAGLTAAGIEAALVVLLLAGLEWVRGWAKHSDK